MPYGDAEVYVRRYPDLPKMPLIKDIAAGVDYMHSLGIIHGDLKGKNILINKDRRAMIETLASVESSGRPLRKAVGITQRPGPGPSDGWLLSSTRRLCLT